MVILEPKEGVPTQYRQGDVFTELLDSDIPEGLNARTNKGTSILAYGESSGHAHRIESKDASLLASNDERMWLEVCAPVNLSHEEHGPIKLAPGKFKVTIAREFHGWGSQRVID